MEVCCILVAAVWFSQSVLTWMISHDEHLLQETTSVLSLFWTLQLSSASLWYTDVTTRHFSLRPLIYDSVRCCCCEFIFICAWFIFSNHLSHILSCYFVPDDVKVWHIHLLLKCLLPLQLPAGLTKMTLPWNLAWVQQQYFLFHHMKKQTLKAATCDISVQLKRMKVQNMKPFQGRFRGNL